MLTELIVVIILQCLQIPNHYVVCLKRIPWDMLIISMKGFILIVNLLSYLGYSGIAKSKISQENTTLLFHCTKYSGT